MRRVLGTLGFVLLAAAMLPFAAFGGKRGVGEWMEMVTGGRR